MINHPLPRRFPTSRTLQPCYAHNLSIASRLLTPDLHSRPYDSNNNTLANIQSDPRNRIPLYPQIPSTHQFDDTHECNGILEGIETQMLRQGHGWRGEPMVGESMRVPKV